MKRIALALLLVLVFAGVSFGQPINYGGAGTSAWNCEFRILNPTASDDYDACYRPNASTLQGMQGNCLGTTSVSITLKYCDGDGLSNCSTLISDATITCGTSKLFTVGASAIPAGKTLVFYSGTLVGTPTYVRASAWGTSP
jgi:hypothetical protein